jgi:hypothetical protein
MNIMHKKKMNVMHKKKMNIMHKRKMYNRQTIGNCQTVIDMRYMLY